MKNNDNAALRSFPIPTGGAAASAASSDRPAWATHKLDQRIIEALVAGDVTLFSQLATSGITEASVRAHASSLGVTNEFIKQCRLSGSRPAMRVCIRCDARFLSSGIHNRLCQRCPTR